MARVLNLFDKDDVGEKFILDLLDSQLIFG